MLYIIIAKKARSSLDFARVIEAAGEKFAGHEFQSDLSS